MPPLSARWRIFWIYIPKLEIVDIPSSVGMKIYINCWNILANPGSHQSEISGERSMPINIMAAVIPWSYFVLKLAGLR